MEKEIKKFKQQNGNLVNYTVKELIGGLNVKIDIILQRLKDGDKKFTQIETNVKWHKRLILGLYSVLGAILVTFISTFKYIKKIFGG